MKSECGRIGLLGGTFNPVHNGHVCLAEAARRRLRLDRVLLIPVAQPPHKGAQMLAPSEDRLAMLRLAVRRRPGLVVSDIEIRRGGVSYSIDTVRALHAQYPGARFFFLIGGDTLTELSTWHRIEELLRLCEFVTLTRPGYAPLPRAAHIALPRPWPARLRARVMDVGAPPISSTTIRARAAAGQPLRNMVPSAVEKYIVARRLYGAEQHGKTTENQRVAKSPKHPACLGGQKGRGCGGAECERGVGGDGLLRPRHRP